MCGLAASIGAPDAAGRVLRMIAGLQHRGDVTDPLFAPHAHLAACTRRLRIVDPHHATQPQISSNGQLRAFLNGQIYNHAELREELIRGGARFRGESDTEVIATAIQVWGAAALTRFEGMFALVVFDLKTGLWLAARDPFGVKPLYVAEELAAGATTFCSEVRPLLGVTEDVDALALPPGHVLTPNGCYRYTPKWRIVEPATPLQLENALQAAVHRRVPEDRTSCVLFSGGLDSSLVLDFAREKVPNTPAYFLGGVTAPDYPFAAEYAERAGTDLRLVALPESVELEEIRRTVEVMEAFEPETVRSGCCSLRLAKAVAHDDLRVALCGEGADELFAGYVPLEVAFGVSGSQGEDLRAQCVSSLASTALQRIDRAGMRHSVEFREPYLDADVVRLAFSSSREQLIAGRQGAWIGKQPLKAVARRRGLSDRLIDRVKSPMNEGSGFDASQREAPWIDFAETAITDRELTEGMSEYRDFRIQSKEELLYLLLLSQSFDIARVPHLRSREHLRVSHAVAAQLPASLRANMVE